MAGRGGSCWIGRSNGNRNAVWIVISSQDVVLSIQPESDRETVNIRANAQRVDHIGSPDQREARRFLSAALELGRRVAIQKIDLLAEEAGRNPLSGVDEAKDHAEWRPQGCRVIDRENIHFLTCRPSIDLKSNRQPIAINNRAISRGRGISDRIEPPGRKWSGKLSARRGKILPRERTAANSHAKEHEENEMFVSDHDMFVSARA